MGVEINTRKSIIQRWGLFVLVIVAILSLSILIYNLHIDWTGQVKSYGYAGIFFVSLLGSMTIMLPLPGDAVMAVAPAIMGLSGVELFWLSLVASIGAALGELTSFFVGYWGRAVIIRKHQKGYDRVKSHMNKYGGPAIILFALTPLPFDLIGIVAGSLRFPLGKFLFYCWVGRMIRSLLIVFLGWSSFHLFFSEDN